MTAASYASVQHPGPIRGFYRPGARKALLWLLPPLALVSSVVAFLIAVFGMPCKATPSSYYTFRACTADHDPLTGDWAKYTAAFLSGASVWLAVALISALMLSGRISVIINLIMAALFIAFALGGREPAALLTPGALLAPVSAPDLPSPVVFLLAGWLSPTSWIIALVAAVPIVRSAQ